MYSIHLAEEGKMKEEKKTELNMSKTKAATKYKAKEAVELATKKARMAHQRAVLTKLAKEKAARQPTRVQPRKYH